MVGGTSLPPLFTNFLGCEIMNACACSICWVYSQGGDEKIKQRQTYYVKNDDDNDDDDGDGDGDGDEDGDDDIMMLSWWYHDDDDDDDDDDGSMMVAWQRPDLINAKLPHSPHTRAIHARSCPAFLLPTHFHLFPPFSLPVSTLFLAPHTVHTRPHIHARLTGALERADVNGRVRMVWVQEKEWQWVQWGHGFADVCGRCGCQGNGNGVGRRTGGHERASMRGRVRTMWVQGKRWKCVGRRNGGHEQAWMRGRVRTV